jgi:hypothetical protein
MPKGFDGRSKVLRRRRRRGKKKRKKTNSNILRGAWECRNSVKYRLSMGRKNIKAVGGRLAAEKSRAGFNNQR